MKKTVTEFIKQYHELGGNDKESHSVPASAENVDQLNVMRELAVTQIEAGQAILKAEYGTEEKMNEFISEFGSAFLTVSIAAMSNDNPMVELMGQMFSQPIHAMICTAFLVGLAYTQEEKETK